MNLKLVVASMSILGLVSCPVLAATQADSPPPHKHRVHHKVKHHRVHHMVSHDYKDYKGMELHPAPVQVCSMPREMLVLKSMTQNKGRACPNPCMPDWFNRIMVAGGVNVDLGKWGSRNANYMGENYQHVSLNDAYVNVGAMVNDWVHAFASFSYNTATISNIYWAPTSSLYHVAEFDTAYSNNVRSDDSNSVQVEQAFATFGNFDVSPFFVQVGKQFQDFSRYEIHPITESLTQVLSKTLATSLKIGFVAGGFNGGVSVFDNPIPRVGSTTYPANYVASLGYMYPSERLGFDIGLGYIYNLIGANDVAYQVNQFNWYNFTLGGGLGAMGYNSRRAGLAAYADVNSGPFVLGARYTTALSRFNVLDLPQNGLAAINPVTTAPFVDQRGARPWAFGIDAGMCFENFFGWGCGGKNKIYVGYQTTREAAGLLLPRHRYLVGASMDIWKYTTLGAEWDHDNAYNVASGGLGRSTNLVSLRAGVKFG